MTDGGNWEGHTILSRVRDDAELGERFGLAPGVVAERLAMARGRLLARRQDRPQPRRDDKVLAAWNGLAIAALADAARALGASGEAGLTEAATRYRAAAVAAAEAVTVGPARGGRPPPSLLEGRPGHGGRRPRGLREPRRGAARPLPGDLRRALVRDRRVPRRHDPRPVRRPGRRLLRHRGGRRAARRPAEGTPGQRDALRRGDGDDRPAPPRRAHRGGPVPGRRRGGDRGRRPVPRRATRRRSPSGSSRSSWPMAGSTRSRSSGIRRRRRRARCWTSSTAGSGRSSSSPRPPRRMRRRSPCSRDGSRSTGGRRRSSAATSRAACRSPSPRPSPRCWCGHERRSGHRPARARR